MNKILTALAGMLFIALASTAAQADWTLNQSNLSTGGATCFNGQVVGGTPSVLVTTPNTCFRRTLDGVTGVGTNVGVPGEIGITPDKLRFEFDRNVFVTELQIAFLYPDGEYNDVGDEVAKIVLLDDLDTVIADFFFYADTKTTGFLADDLGGTDNGTAWANLGIAQDGVNDGGAGGGGHWQIGLAADGVSIFGDFRTMEIYGVSEPQPFGDNRDSDFGFVSLTGDTSVPEPSAMAVFGVGIFALGWASRRRRKVVA
jgi:hypothetical protein